jgi:biopolymer transport protein ExbB
MMFLFAEATESSVFDQILNSGVMKYMFEGGPFMWPILLMGIIATAVCIERFRALRMLTVDDSELRDQVIILVQGNKPEEALALCERSPGPVAAILAVGLRRYLMLRDLESEPRKIEEQTDKAMEDAGPHVIAVLEKHLPILGTISAVAPMVGSVGTVVGMVVLFQDIAARFGTQNIIVAAADGIKVKLLVTVFGLLVGIPAYAAYNYFSTVINGYMLHVEESATKLNEAVTVRLELDDKQRTIEKPVLSEHVVPETASR